jgi:NADPH:quinone reductase-like Zn-dependent oxidoreductase
LRPGGKLISTVSPPDQALAKQYSLTAAFFLVEVTTERLRNITSLIDAGELKTRIGAVLDLAEARKAHLMLDNRETRPQGKIVLNVI